MGNKTSFPWKYAWIFLMGSDQILVVGGQASGVAAVRSYQKIFQCQAEAMPDGSRMDYAGQGWAIQRL